jgi:hypothetical protein
MLELAKRRFIRLAGLSYRSSHSSEPAMVEAAGEAGGQGAQGHHRDFWRRGALFRDFRSKGPAKHPVPGRMKPHGLFFRTCTNAGVLSHSNSTASILTGNWPRLDDFGFQPSATIFEYYKTNWYQSRWTPGSLRSTRAFRSSGQAQSEIGAGLREQTLSCPSTFCSKP